MFQRQVNQALRSCVEILVREISQSILVVAFIQQVFEFESPYLGTDASSCILPGGLRWPFAALPAVAG